MGLSMATELRAIETTYNGYRFRSRAEARFAVFMDALSVRYRYEPEGHPVGPGLAYLPDFWLPQLNCYVEIKGESPNDEERLKAQRLAEIAKRDVYLFDQLDFGVPTFDPTKVDELTGAWAWRFRRDTEPDRLYWWGECALCCLYLGEPWYGISGSEHEAEHFRRVHPRTSPDAAFLAIVRGSIAMQRAYAAARSARFEFGQTPEVPRT